MAGSSLGTVFVELSLDDRVYRQKLSETLTSSQATAKGIEASWRALGTKSDAYFDAQRKSAENAYTLIKRSHTSTQQEIVRAHEAATARINMLNEQQYGKQAGIIDGIKKNWIAASAAIAASWYAANKVVGSLSDVVMAAARYETLGVVMRVVGNNAGYTGAQMEKFAQGLEKTGISMTEARQSLIRMTQAHLDLNKASQLARVAQDAAVIGNINSSEAFQRMVYGIQSGQVEILRTIGINVNFENSYQEVAKATGKAATSFTEAEKSQIRMNATMKAGESIAGTYESAMDTAGKQALSLARHTENLKVMLGLTFTPVYAEIIEQITGGLVGLNGELSGPGKEAIADWGTNFRLMLIDIEAEVTRLAMLLDKLGGTMSAGKMLLYGPGKALGFKSSSDRFDVAAQQNIDYENRYIKSDAALESLMVKRIKLEDSMTASGKAATKAAQDAAEAKLLALQKQAEKQREAAAEDKKAIAAAKKLREEWERTQQALGNDIRLEGLSGARLEFERTLIKYEELEKQVNALPPSLQKGAKAFIDLWKAEKDAGTITEAVTKSREANTKAMKEEAEVAIKAAKEAEQAAKDRLQAERNIYEDLRGYASSYYDAASRMIQNQAAEYRRLGVDTVAVAAWVAEEQEKAIIKVLRKGDDFFGGMAAGFIQLKNDAMTWGEAAYGAVLEFSNSASGTMSDIFFDGFKGELKSLEDYFKSIFDSMLRYMTDIAGKMITNWAMFGNAMGPTVAGGSAGAGSSLSAMSLMGFVPTGGLLGSAAGALGIGGGIAGLSAGSGAATIANMAMSLGFGSETAATIGMGAGAIGSAMPWIGGAFLVDQLLGGNITNGISSLLGLTKNAGFGSATHNATGSGAYGELPSFGDWFALDRGSGAASSDLIASFTTGITDSIQGVYDQVDTFIGTLTEDAQTAARAKLAAMTLSYLPALEGTTYSRNGQSVTDLNLTRETAGGLDAYVASIQSFIMGQIAPELAEFNDDVATSADVLRLSNDRRALEIEIMKLTGDTSGAIAAQRADELAALDESLRPLQEYIYSLQDQADAAEAAAKAADEAAKTQAKAAEEQAKATEELAKAQEEAAQKMASAQQSVYATWASLMSKGVTEAATALRASFDAGKQRMAAIYNSELEAMNTNLDAAKTIVSGLESNVNKLRSAIERMHLESVAQDLNTYNAAGRKLEAVLMQARAGDLSGVSGLDSTLDTLTNISAASYASQEDYQRAYWKTYYGISELNTISGRQLDKEKSMVGLLENQIATSRLIHDSELAAMDSQMNALLGINNSVLSISESIIALAAAIDRSKSATQAVASLSPNAVYYSANVAYWGGNEAYATAIKDKLSQGIALADPVGAEAFIRDNPNYFADGGIASGPESGYTATLHGTELVVSPRKSFPATVKDGGNADLIEEVRALRAELKEIKASNAKIAKSSDETMNILDKMDVIGMPATRT